ncbi:MAG: dethiobiotin synthase [Thioalkalispiraceae bacterium]|jgi:dethiobiotin synthetase
MAKGVFITGTDTEIGKTLVSCLLIDALVQEGNQVIGMKPIASGAEKVNGRLQNEDAIHLMRHSNIEMPYSSVNPYCFQPPIAPHIAARQNGQQIEIAMIQRAYKNLAQEADWVIVEGVGGWKVPINNEEMVSDLASGLDLPIIMVVGMKLGCINHALLTASAIRANGNRLIGWVANQLSLQMPVYKENLQALQNLLQCPLIAEIPYLQDDQSDLKKPININLDHLKS